MGFCILGGKENYLRKTIADKLTSLGETIGIGATATAFASAIQAIYDDRFTAGQDSLKVTRKLTLPAAATGNNYDIPDNWYTSVDASAVYSKGVTDARQGTAAASDVRASKTFTNSSGSGTQGSMPDLNSSNFSHAFSSSTAGATANLNVTSAKAGYVPSGTNVRSIAAGTNSTAIAVTGGTGEETVNIVPGVYNKIKVNRTAAYNAGASSGASLSVYALQTNSNGSGSIRGSASATLPAGTYHVAVHLYTHGNGETYMPTVTLTFGNVTRTYHNSVPSTGSGYYETGNVLSIIDTFTLATSTAVSLAMSNVGTNYGMSNGVATVY